MDFECRVLTDKSQIATVTVKAENRISALKKLKSKGYTIISINEVQNIKELKKKEEQAKMSSVIYTKKLKKRNKIFHKVVPLSNEVSIDELKQFSKDFYMLKKLGFSTEHALITILNDIENLYFQDILKKIEENLKKDIKMYKTMKEYPNVFPEIYINYFRVGELSDNLLQYLEFAIRYLENKSRINEKIREDLIPGIYMTVSIIIITIFSLVFVIPTLNDMLIANGIVSKMPRVIRIISDVLRVILYSWYVWVVLFIAGIVLLKKYSTTEKGKKKRDIYKYKNGITGKINYYLDFSRFIRTLEINLQNKIRFQDALEMSKIAVRNKYMLDLIEKSINNYYVSKSWLIPFEKDGMLNSIVIELLKKFSNNNDIEILHNTIEYIERTVENDIEELTKKLPLISYSIVGLSLFLLLLLVIIPCVQIYLNGFLL